MMMSRWLVLLAVLWNAPYNLADDAITDPEIKAALTALYFALDYASWIDRDNWLDDTALATCGWVGLGCGVAPDDVTTGQVLAIDLSGSGLGGTLPSELGVFTNMNQLYLDSNSIAGSMPSQLGRMSILTRLQLFANSLTGSIPSEIFSLTGMINFFRLDENQLTGSLPSEIGRLTAITQALNVRTNALSGSIPSQIGLLSSMKVALFLNVNSFSQDIPSELGQLTGLTNNLALSNNLLSGSIPSQIGLLTNTNNFDLSLNDLCGLIPTEVAALANLDTADNTKLGTACPSPTPQPSITSLNPTLSPTVSPTVTCAAGTYTVDCLPCPAGQYSTNTSPEWLTSCTACAAGTYTKTTGNTNCLTCAGGKISADDRTDCVSCDPGQYSNATASICVDCEFGTYAPLPQTDGCLSCAAGSRTNNDTKATTCTPCNSGTYSEGSTDTCTPCARGSYSPSGQSSCSDCEAGKYSNETGSSSCTSCGSGKYTFDEGNQVCDDCEAGKYVGTSGASSCLNCSVGFISSTAGSSSCTACTSGKYAPVETLTECLVCDVGRAQGSTGQDTCVDCEKGTIAPNNGSSSCSSCGSGTFAATTGSTACSDCPAGRAVGNTAASECTNCSAGFVALNTGSSSCTACEAGKYSVYEAMTECTDCPVGKAQGATGQQSCTNCIEGYFSANTGASSCDGCDNGKYSTSGSSSCTEAEEDYFVNPYTDSVEECPNHAKCVGGTYLPRPDSDYYIYRNSEKYAAVIYRCTRKTCVQKATIDCWDTSYFNNTWLAKNGLEDTCESDDVQCSFGSKGPICGSCIDGYIFSSADQRCIECSSSFERLIPFAIIAVVVGVFAYLLKTDRVRVEACVDSTWLGMLLRIDSGMMRVLWSNYQIIHSVTWSLDVVFPSPFKNFLGFLGFFSFDFINLECVVGRANYYTSVYLWSALPITASLIILLVYFANVVFLNMQDTDDSTYTTEMEDAKVKFIYYFLLLTYIVLPTISLKQFQALDCFTLAGNEYLRIDTDVDCGSSSYQLFRLVDIFLILLYMATPFMWSVILYYYRHRLNPKTTDARLAQFLRSEDKELAPYRFLFEPYQPCYYYFEVLEIYRRVIFIGVLPLISSRSDRRAAIGVFLAIVSMALYRESQPFIRQSTNLIVYVAQYAILATFGAALAIDVQLNNGLNPLAFGSVLCAVNFTVILMAFWLSGERYRREMKAFRALRNRSANGKIEKAIGFSDDKFTTTLDSLDANFVSPSQCIVFAYTSLSAANKALKQGIPAVARKGDQDGILFTLHRPYELDEVDRAVFGSFEAVLACNIPLLYLQTLDGSKYLRLVEGNVLKALRANDFHEIADPTPWFNGGVLLPPKQIVRAFQLIEVPATTMLGTGKDVDMLKDSTHVRTTLPRRTSTDNDGFRARRFRLRSKGATSSASFNNAESLSERINSVDSLSSSLHGISNHGSMGSFKGNRAPEVTWENFLRIPTTCAEFCADMSLLRVQCSEQGWHPVFHYTQPYLGPMIFKTGFRMSTQGQGDGGVYFSTLGPASYEVGADEYESNIIVDCFGESRLHEYADKHYLDLVFVYGVEPDFLSQAPGGRSNAKMVSKAVFESLSVPHADGNYFLRADRIIGAFLIDPSNPPAFTTDAMEPLVVERNLDSQSREELTAAQDAMEKSSRATRELLRMRPKSHHMHDGRGHTPKRGNSAPRPKSPFNAARSKTPPKTSLMSGGGLGRRGSGSRSTSAGLRSRPTEENKSNGLIELKEKSIGSGDTDKESLVSGSDLTATISEETDDGVAPGGSDEHERRKSDHVIRASSSFKPKNIPVASNKSSSKKTTPSKKSSSTKKSKSPTSSPSRNQRLQSAEFSDGFAGGEQSIDKMPSEEDATFI